MDIISSLDKTEVDLQWLHDETEKFCKDKAIYNAVLDGISIIDGKDKNRTPEAIPSILSEALQVSFDLSVGHDYVEDGLDSLDDILEEVGEKRAKQAGGGIAYLLGE